jgi:hypothetical protein
MLRLTLLDKELLGLMLLDGVFSPLIDDEILLLGESELLIEPLIELLGETESLIDDETDVDTLADTLDDVELLTEFDALLLTLFDKEEDMDSDTLGLILALSDKLDETLELAEGCGQRSTLYIYPPSVEIMFP